MNIQNHLVYEKLEFLISNPIFFSLTKNVILDLLSHTNLVLYSLTNKNNHKIIKDYCYQKIGNPIKAHYTLTNFQHIKGLAYRDGYTCNKCHFISVIDLDRSDLCYECKQALCRICDTELMEKYQDCTECNRFYCNKCEANLCKYCNEVKCRRHLRKCETCNTMYCNKCKINGLCPNQHVPII
jgi:hypothetical protein